LLNHLLARLGVEELLERFVPTSERRSALSHARALGVLLRSILVEREPVYRQQETANTFAPQAFGLAPGQGAYLRDDRVGRALDRLFDADRAALLTELVVNLQKRFGVQFSRLHNDTTSVRFTGQYAAARGRSIRGRRAPWITYGYSKDHRPDLKQLVLVLCVAADGGLPVLFRCEGGQTNDASTHVTTWDTLCRLAGRADFLYVADSKLCGEGAMDHIDRRQGRFVCVLPRSRREDAEFRKWIQDHEIPWELVIDRRHPRRRRGPRDRWYVWRATLPSKESWPVTWVFSELLALRQEATRRENLARAQQELDRLRQRLEDRRPRAGHKLQERVARLLARRRVTRYVLVNVHQQPEHEYRQERSGRPGPDTRYRRITRKCWKIDWRVDETAIAYDRKSDGMYPLLGNDRTLTPAQVLQAHKGQPAIERRFEGWKSVQQIAPVFLKNEGRIEALFTLYWIALLVHALLERELRNAMKREGIAEIPLYPEERQSRRPTAEQVLRLFSHVSRHVVTRTDKTTETFDPDLTELQALILRLLGISTRAYTRSA
jgi:transposase